MILEVGSIAISQVSSLINENLIHNHMENTDAMKSSKTIVKSLTLIRKDE